MRFTVTTSQLQGLGRIPASKPACLAWLERRKIRAACRENGFKFSLADLPNEERLAFVKTQLDDLGLEMGQYDDEAHDVFLQAGKSRRDRAERNAAMVCLCIALERTGCTWEERITLIAEKYGKKGSSKPTLKRLLKRVEGVDPINFAPTLLDEYKGGSQTAEISDEAWSFFMTTIRDAARDFPLKQAWRDARDVGRAKGWKVASYPTFYRRWCALSEAERSHARDGYQETVKRLSMPIHRDKSSVLPLEWVSLDGRTKDFWCDFGDGRALRATFLALVDVASNFVLGWEIAPSENAASTVRLITKVCEEHGIFDRLYTDNGAAFAGHLVAGGIKFKFRNRGKAAEGVQPIGVCRHLGIDVKFAMPANGQAKIAERTFATLSRVIDDRPEFRGCHAGHAAGASPSSDVVPISIDNAKRVVEREVHRHNRELGRKSRGARGRSYEAVFSDGLKHRITRRPTERQLYLAGLIWKPVSVDRYGQVKINGWVYGTPSTQADLLQHHKRGQILLGRNPDDFSAPAMAFDDSGNLICAEIQPVQAGPYDSVDGIREAARNRKAAKDATRKAAVANNYQSKREFEEALAMLEAPETELTVRENRVVAPQFKTPLSEVPERQQHSIPEEHTRNFARFIGSGEKSA